jgi:preprotein translocase SecE subunit
MIDTVTTYINEATEELRHVRWPTRQQAVRLSLIVIGFTAGSAAVFGLIDFLLAQLTTFALTLT